MASYHQTNSPLLNHREIEVQFVAQLERLKISTEFDLRSFVPADYLRDLSSTNLIHALSAKILSPEATWVKDTSGLKNIYDTLDAKDCTFIIHYFTRCFDAAQSINGVWLGQASGARNDIKEWNQFALHGQDSNRVGSLIIQDLIFNGVAAVNVLDKIYQTEHRKDTVFSPKSILNQNLGALIQEVRENGNFKRDYSSLSALQIVYKAVADSLVLIAQPTIAGLIFPQDRLGLADGERPVSDKVSRIAFKLLWDQVVLTFNHYQDYSGFQNDIHVVSRILATTLNCILEPDFKFKNLPEDSEDCQLCIWPEAVRNMVDVQNSVLTFLLHKVPNDSGYLSYGSDDDIMTMSPLRTEASRSQNDLLQNLNWALRHKELHPEGAVDEQTRLAKIMHVIRFELIVIFGNDLSKDKIETEMAKDWKQINPIFRELFFPEILLYKLTDVPSYFDTLDNLARPGINGKQWGIQERKSVVDKIKIPLRSDTQLDSRKTDNDILLGQLNESLISLQFGDRRFISGPELAQYLLEDIKVEDRTKGDSQQRGIFSSNAKHPAIQIDMLLKAADTQAYAIGIPAFSVMKHDLLPQDRTSMHSVILDLIKEFSTLPLFSEVDPSLVGKLVEQVDLMLVKENGSTSIPVVNFALALRYYLEQSRNRQFELISELQSISLGHRQDPLSHYIAKLMVGERLVSQETDAGVNTQGFRNIISAGLFEYDATGFSSLQAPYSANLLKTTFNYIYRESCGQKGQFQIMRDVIRIFKNYDETNTNQEAHSVLVALPYVMHCFNRNYHNGDQAALTRRLELRLQAIAEIVFESDARHFIKVKEALLAIQGLGELSSSANISSRAIDDIRFAAENANNPFIEVYDIMRSREKIQVSQFIDSLDGQLGDFIANLNKFAQVPFEKKVSGSEIIKYREGVWLLTETKAEANLFRACFDPTVKTEEFMELVQNSPFNIYPLVYAFNSNTLSSKQLAELAYDAALFKRHVEERDRNDEERWSKEDQIKIVALEAYFDSVSDPITIGKFQAYLYHVVYSNMQIYNHFTYRSDQPALTNNPRAYSDDLELHDEYFRLVIGARQIGYHVITADSLERWSNQFYVRRPVENPHVLQFNPNDSAMNIFASKVLSELPINSVSEERAPGTEQVQPNAVPLPEVPMDPATRKAMRGILTQMLSSLQEDETGSAQ